MELTYCHFVCKIDNVSAYNKHLCQNKTNTINRDRTKEEHPPGYMFHNRSERREDSGKAACEGWIPKECYHYFYLAGAR